MEAVADGVLAVDDRIADAHDWTVTATERADGGGRFAFRGVDTDVDAAEADLDPIPDDSLWS